MERQNWLNMCGVAGYIGDAPSSPILLEMLRALEYRGYDSFGLAVLDGDETDRVGRLQVKKFIGPVNQFQARAVGGIHGFAGIAHTRWATHGAVTLENAHPHLDCSQSVAVVHNGIVENSDRLRRFLERRDHRFTSQTDSEVIPHLIEERLRISANLREAIREAASRIRGSSSFLVLSRLDPKHIFGVKLGLPLAVGIGSGANLISSDPSSFPRWVKGVVLLEDRDLAIIGASSVQIVDSLTGISKKRGITWRRSQQSPFQKLGFRHYMEKEIHEQPSILKRISQKGMVGLDKLAKSLQQAERVFLVGSGSSYHACLSGSYFFSEVAGIEGRPLMASMFPKFSNLASEGDAVIAISQSGETADILDAISAAKKAGMKIYSITNNSGSTLGRLSEVAVDICAGPERGVAATKTYTGEVAALYLVAEQMAGRPREALDELRDASRSISKRMTDFVGKARSLASELHRVDLLLLIGRDAAFPTAMEAALKVREVSYIPSLGLEGSELKHGNLALISDGVPCVVFSPQGDTFIVGNAREAQSRGAQVIWISEGTTREFGKTVQIPPAGPLFPIYAIIPMQLFAYEMAILRGNNPDRPRNLAKCVTVR